jgi:ribonuclease HI
MIEPFSPKQTQPVEFLVRHLELPRFDLLLVGDGSGTRLDQSCGWCCTSYCPGAGSTVQFGGTNGGTNNFAELSPYLHALWLYHTRRYGNSGDTPRSRGEQVAVVIVSDSEITVRCGQGVYARRANAGLWASLQWYEANGYQFTWRHVRRNTNPLSTRADEVAGRVRTLLSELNEEEIHRDRIWHQ